MTNKVGKRLIHLLIKTLLVSSIALPLVFAGCEPDKNSPPEAKLEVNPTSGNAPLEISMKLTGNDLDGVEDIKEYNLYIQGKDVIKRSHPIDTTITFRNSGNYSVLGEVVDKEEQINKAYEDV